MVAILSLQSPLVIDFTPHPRLKECVNKERATAEGPGTKGAASEDGANSVSDELIHREEDDHKPCSVLLMPCSLLIFKDQAYSGKKNYFWVILIVIFPFEY